MTPKIRQTLYAVAAVASALIPVLITLKLVDPELGNGLLNLVAVLGTLGAGGAGVAAVVTSRQRKDGTLDFTGTPAQQAIEAIKATVQQAADSSTDLQRVIRTASEVLIATPSVGDHNDPAQANYQP
jgi:hypothetical protein